MFLYMCVDGCTGMCMFVCVSNSLLMNTIAQEWKHGLILNTTCPLLQGRSKIICGQK